MSGPKQVIIKFDQSGGAHVDAKNFVGGACAEHTKVYLKLLGGSQKEQRKPEFSQPTGQTQKVGQKW